MKIRPGPTLLWLAGIAAAATGLILYDGGFVWLAALAGGLVVAVAALDLLELVDRMHRVSVSPVVPERAWRNRPFTVSLKLSNPCSRAVPLQTRYVVPAEAEPGVWIAQETVPAGGAVECRQTFRIPVRGAFHCGPVYLRVAGRLRGLEAQKRVDDLHALRVFPEITAHKARFERRVRHSVHQLNKLASDRQWGASTEFESLQEYRPGDDPRRIDWKASARLASLIVRRLQVERQRDVVLLLDTGRLMGTETDDGTKLDCAVNAAAALAAVAIRSGDRCGLGLFDDRVRDYHDPRSGTAALRSIMDGLNDAASRGRESNFDDMFEVLRERQRKRALIVVLSDLVDAETSMGQRLALRMLARRHELLFVTIRTPLLDALVHGQVETNLDLSRHVVAFRLLRDRDRTLHMLRNSGVRVLDATPEQIAGTLVEHYIDIRLRKVL